MRKFQSPFYGIRLLCFGAIGLVCLSQFLLVCTDIPDTATVFPPDSVVYITIASYLTTTGMYTYDGNLPTLRREPLYPLLIAGLITCGLIHPHVLTVRNVIPLLVVQFGLYLLAVWYVSAITASYFGELAAGGTILFLGAYPEFSQYWYMVLSEIVYLACVAGCFYGLWKYSTRHYSRYLLMGAVWAGLACVTKSVTLPYLLCIFVGLMFIRTNRSRLLLAVCFLGISTIFPLIWGIRNQMRFGQMILTSTDGGSSLYRGNLYIGELIPNLDDPHIPADVRQAIHGMDEIEQDHFLRAQGLDLFKTSPLDILAKLTYKLGRLTLGADSQPGSVCKLILLGLVLWSLPRHLAARNVYFLLCASYSTYLAAIYTLIYTTPRYFVPALFVLSPFCLDTLVHYIPYGRLDRGKTEIQTL